MKTWTRTGAAAIAAALFFLIGVKPALAVDFRHPRQQRDLSPGLQQSLSDHLSDEAGHYFDAEDEKRAQHKVYVDLQQKFEYLPNWGPRNSLVVSAKLGGVEYDPNKPGTSKGAATGTLKYLVFTYSLQKGKWVEIAKPKWESQALGAAAGKKITQDMVRGEQRKAAVQKAAQTRAAAAAAAAAAQKAANRGN